MEAYVRAGVDFYESTLRYAEIERNGSEYKLLKLGSCEFDFNMARALSEGAHPTHLETLSEALNDVFSGSNASELHVVFHPGSCYSFFTPLSVELTEEQRKWRLQEEATLLTSSTPPLPLHLTADVVRTETLENGSDVEWFHVLGVDERMHSQLSNILSTLPHNHFRFNLSTRGTANAIETMARKENMVAAPESRFTLAIGYYKTHIEYVISDNFEWYYSHYTDASTPTDSVYFAMSLLRRLNIDRAAVGKLFIYGEDIEAEVFSVLQEIFKKTPEVLNPMEVVTLDRKGPGMHFTAEAYAPCIGIAM